jgi:hypothetical protein
VGWLPRLEGVEGVAEGEPRIEVLSGTFGDIDESSRIIACSEVVERRQIEVLLHMMFILPEDDCGPESMAVTVGTRFDRDALVGDGAGEACVLPAGPARLELLLSPPPSELPGFLVGWGTLEIHEAVYSEGGAGVSVRGEMHFDLADDWSPPFAATCPWWLGLRFEAPPCPPEEE